MKKWQLKYLQIKASQLLVDSLEVMGKTECYIEMPMPNVSGKIKTWMSYEKITSVNSKQYKLQKYAWTDHEGFRRYGEYYMIALGSGYNGKIGDIYRITLENGNVFTAVLSDIKEDKHTDDSNRYVVSNSNIVEFVVDSGVLCIDAKYHGDISCIEGFDGAVLKIEKRITKIITV